MPSSAWSKWDEYPQRLAIRLDDVAAASGFLSGNGKLIYRHRVPYNFCARGRTRSGNERIKFGNPLVAELNL